MREALNELPSTPDEAFENILRRIEQQEHRAATTAKRTLTWCYYSRRPLQMDELRQALVVEDTHRALKSSGKTATSIVDCCLSFITHDQSTGGVRFIHPSVQRWFKGEPQNQKLLTHDYLAKTCLTYLNFDVFGTFGTFDVPINYSIIKVITPYPFLKYATRFWGDHTREAQQDPTVQKAAWALLEAENRRNLMLIVANDGYPKRQTALHVAASCGLAALCHSLLLEAGTEVDVQEEDGVTALHRAASEGHERVVKILLEAGAEVNKQGRRGGTAFNWAASRGDERVEETLLEAGAEVDEELAEILQRRKVAKGDLAAEKANDPETGRGERLFEDIVPSGRILSPEFGDTSREVTESCLSEEEEEEESQYLLAADDSDME